MVRDVNLEQKKLLNGAEVQLPVLGFEEVSGRSLVWEKTLLLANQEDGSTQRFSAAADQTRLKGDRVIWFFFTFPGNEHACGRFPPSQRYCMMKQSGDDQSDRFRL